MVQTYSENDDNGVTFVDDGDNGGGHYDDNDNDNNYDDLHNFNLTYFSPLVRC